MFAAAVVSVAILAAAVKAQDFSSFPSACATACSAFVENSVQCSTQYPATADVTSGAQACFCDALPASALGDCAACLQTNNAASAYTYVNTLPATCQDFTQKCTNQCDFPTCASSDINCQCSQTYLQNIYNCGSCNTANKNTGVTLLTDYTALLSSCEGQTLIASADAPKATDPALMPTSAPYTAPALTGNGVYVSSSSATAKGAVPSTLSKVVSAAGAGPTTAKGASTASGAAAAASGSTTPAASGALTPNAAGKQAALGMGAVSGIAAVVLSLLL